jgi:hypothetical protein
MFVIALLILGLRPQVWMDLHQVGLNEIVQSLR